MPIKVLILEDNSGDFQDIAFHIKKKFGDALQVYPQFERGILDAEDFHYFREALLEMARFEEIVAYYHDIDLFIIDINLLNETDRLGTRFYNFITENRYRDGKYYVIEVSNGFSEMKAPNTKYVGKLSDPLYYNRIADIITDVFNPLERGTINTSAPKKVPHATFEHGKIDGLNKKIKNLDKTVRWLLHGTITFFFYGLITLAISFGTLNIALDFVKLWREKQGAMDIFKPAEHIFLYLLPVFIIFGFYNYYKTNTSVYLLGGNKEKIDEEKSTKSMNLTKMIFISTIISYVLVKCTEEIFYGTCDNPYRLAGAGILLLLLMGYFIKLYSKEH